MVSESSRDAVVKATRPTPMVLLSFTVSPWGVVEFLLFITGAREIGV